MAYFSDAMKRRFNWHSDPLHPGTLLGTGFTTTQNVRRYFRDALGREVRFSRAFLQWMKTHPEATLGAAVEEFRRQSSAPEG